MHYGLHYGSACQGFTVMSRVEAVEFFRGRIFARSLPLPFPVFRVIRTFTFAARLCARLLSHLYPLGLVLLRAAFDLHRRLHLVHVSTNKARFPFFVSSLIAL